MKWVALLRGINVGSSNRIKMADLRVVCESLHWSNVKTYIQSGNVLFNSNEAKAKLEEQLARALKKHHAIITPVIVVESSHWQIAVDNLPFQQENINHLYLTWLNQSLSSEQKRVLENAEAHSTHFKLFDNKVYLNIHEPYHKTKWNNSFFEKKLGVKATTRNWKTVLKINEMLS